MSFPLFKIRADIITHGVKSPTDYQIDYGIVNPNLYPIEQKLAFNSLIAVQHISKSIQSASSQCSSSR